MMEGFNPMIDAAIVGGFMMFLIVVAMVGDKFFPIKKKPAPRGATRV